MFYTQSQLAVYIPISKKYIRLKIDGLPKMAATIWDTRPFKPFSSVEISSRVVSAFSAHWAEAFFSSSQVFFLAAKLVFKFSVSKRLICSLKLADLISASWLASRVFASANCEFNSDKAFCKTFRWVKILLQVQKSRFKSQVLYKKPLDTRGLMYAKTNFYDSKDIL